jgi:hypothetical protein
MQNQMSAMGQKRTFEKGHQLRCHYSMYDFSRRIAAGEKFPSGVLGFKPFDPTVLIGHLPMPECAKCVVHRALYSVSLNLTFANHDNVI